jgi:hypothetical protein
MEAALPVSPAHEGSPAPKETDMRATHLHPSRPPQTCGRNVIIVALDGTIPADIPDANVLVVAPALNSWLRHWVSDDDGARRRAQERVATWVDRLERRGVRVAGRIGDADPLLAIADALPTFPADEIIVAGQRERPAGLVDELVTRARDRFTLPILRAGRALPHTA